MNSEFTCLHQQLKIGDAHLANCNVCGAFFPKSGALVIRNKKRYSEMNRMFSSDILRSMYSLCHQKSQRPDENMKISNSYQEVRSLIIDWLNEVSDTLKLTNRSLFHSVTIMDKFLSNQMIKKGVEMEQNTIMLQGLSCLFISAKNYEMDPTVPSSKKFLKQLPGYKPTQVEQRFDNNAYSMNADRNGKFNAKKNELCDQEQYILNLLAFELDTYPLFIDITEIFMAMGILFTNDKVQPPNHQPKQIVPNQEMITLCEKYIDVFSLLSLQDPKLINTNHYLIACSICSAARKYCHLQPVWTQELVQLTGLQHTHFCNIEKRLIGKFEQKMTGQDKDLRASIASSSMLSEVVASATRSEQQRVASRSPQKQEQPQPAAVQQRPSEPTYEARNSEIQERQYKEAIAQREREQDYQIQLEKKYSEAAQSKYRPLEQNFVQHEQPQFAKNQSAPVQQQMESTHQRLLLQQPNKENYDLNHERERISQQIANIEINNSQAATAERQQQVETKVEPIMKPIVDNREDIQNKKLQKSHVFQKLIQNNKTKYENKIKEESLQTVKTEGSTMASNQSSAKKEPISQRPSNVQIGGQLDYEKRQQELRAKYGSNKNKASYYSSKLGMQQNQLGKHNFGSTKSSVNKVSGRTSSQSYSQQQTASQIARQKSTTSVNSTSRERGSGSFSTRLMSGTISSKVKNDTDRKKTNSISTTAGQSRVYTRQMSSLRNQVHGVRAPSVNSNSSINTGFNSSRQGVVRTASNMNRNSYLQDSEQKSMVRVALKNQRRETKVTGTGYQTSISKNQTRAGQHNTLQNSSRTNNVRNRVASGVPFLKSQQDGIGSSQRQSYVGHGSSSNIHLGNQQRNSSVMSNNSNNSVNRKIGTATSNLRTKTINANHQRENSATSIRSNDGGMVNGLRNQNQHSTNVRSAQPVVTQPKKQDDFPDKDVTEHQKLMAHYSQFQSKITGLRRNDK